MGGKSNSKNVIYQADIFPKEVNFKDKVYIGISALNCKHKWYNHWQLFSNLLLNNETVLSIIGRLNDRGLTAQIKWKLIKKNSEANSLNGRCNICLEEKISILKYKDSREQISKRNELIFKHRHRNKFELKYDEEMLWSSQY